MLNIREIPLNQRFKQLFRKALIITLIGNVFLAGIKSWAFYISRSTAIYSDAINSISDVVYSILLIIGLWLSQRPPDISHPQGHSRFEPFVSLMIIISMSLAGIEAFRASYIRFIQGGFSFDLDIPALTLVLSAGIKGGMYFFIKDIAKKTLSPGLDASAHDNLSDMLTSLAAFLGVLGASLIHPLFDPAAGVAVSLWIFRSAYLAARKNFGFLTGAGASKEVIEKIIKTAKQVDGVKNVHHLISEHSGPKLVIDMHINVDGDLSLNQAHMICDKVIKKIEYLKEVDRAYVHVEPLGHQ